MSDPLSLLQHVAEDAGPLVRVQFVTWKELPNDKVSFLLTFQKMELTIAARDDDTVELLEGNANAESDFTVHSCEEFPWLEAIGKPVRWGWMMTNQQGYQDAVQLEFARNVSEPATIVQFVAVASSLKVLSVRETHEAVQEKLMAVR